MQDSNSSSWRQPYLEALKETNKEKLNELAYSVEGAIFFRRQELAGSVDHQEEWDEMNSALATLLKIRTEKLGWPSSLPSEPSPQND